MPEITIEQIAAVVEELRIADEDAAKALKLPDPDDASRPYSVIEAAGPANTEEIAEAEQALGRRFPPSYRHFLSLHNGWKEMGLGSDLLSLKALVEFNKLYAAKALGPILEEIERETSENLVVFGKFPSDSSMFIFDTAQADEFGEWSVIEYDAEEGMLDEYENFLDFLTDAIDTVRVMAGWPESGYATN